VFVTNRTAGPGGEGVTVFDTADPITRVTGIPHSSWNQPTSIVEVPALNFIVVLADPGAGVLTFIDSLSFTVLGTVSIPGSRALGGMAVSADQGTIFVAGQTTVLGNDPAVFRVALQANAPYGAPQAPLVFDDDGATAKDCAVVRASAVGGSGNGPGKVFFSVPNGGTGTGDTDGYLVIADLVGGTTARHDVGTAPLANVVNPTQMDSAPDDSVVFVACTTIAAAASNRAIRVDAVSNARSEILLTSGLTNTAPHAVVDVSFRVDTGNGVRAYFVTGVEDTNGNRIHQRDSSGAQVSPPVTMGGINPLSVRQSANPNDGSLFVGNANGTSATFERWDTSAAPPASPTQLTSGTGPIPSPTGFAFAVNPTPQIFDVCGKGGPNAAGTRVVVLGGNFVNGAQVRLIDLAGNPLLLNTVSMTSNQIVASLPGPVATPQEMTVRVTNPDGQVAEFKQYFTACTQAPAAFTLTLPNRVQGYRMLSVPAYADLLALGQGLEAALGPYNRFFYRVFFINAKGEYVEATDFPAEGCELAGNAFWAITRFGAQATVTGLDCFANAVNGTRSVKLVPGWNMVSTPYFDTTLNEFRILWSDVLTTDDGVAWSNQQGADQTAPFTRLTGGLLIEYVNGAYATTNVLEAGKGYFVHNATNGPLFLLFNTGDVFKQGQGPEPSYGALPPGVTPPPPPGDVEDASSDSGGGCGLLGPEFLLLGLARLVWRRARPRRTLRA
jgi:hypothetical protein